MLFSKQTVALNDDWAMNRRHGTDSGQAAGDDRGAGAPLGQTFSSMRALLPLRSRR